MAFDFELVERFGFICFFSHSSYLKFDPLKYLLIETCTRQTAQTSLTLRSMVLITESNRPLSTCLATLSVKPFTV